MNEDGETSVLRRGLWIGLWFIVVAAVLWGLVWLIFLRNSTPDASTLQGSNTKHSQSTGNRPSGGTTKPATGTSDGSSSSSTTGGGSGSTTGTTAPGQLVNTGAGDVFVPFAAASVIGGVLYQVHLRRKAAGQE